MIEPKNIFVVRQRSREDGTGTPGNIYVRETGFKCDSLELIWADNRKGLSCIKADTYRAWTWTSPTLNKPGHGKVLRLEDKHGRGDCLVHNGNWAGNTEIDANNDGKADLITNIHGCTETGRGYGQVGKPRGGTQWGIMASTPTLNQFLADIGDATRDEPHLVTYGWAPGCAPEGEPEFTEEQMAEITSQEH